MMFTISRRVFLGSVTAGTAAAGLPTTGLGQAVGSTPPLKGRVYKSLKWGMIDIPGTVQEKFELLKEIGFDGVELDSPGGVNKEAALDASKKTGLPIDGTVDSSHWKIRLSDENPEIRDRGLQDLLTAIRETRFVGGHSVLLVPGHGDDGSKVEVVERAAEQVSKAIPLAAKLGVSIVIENVWNKMFYDHDGPHDQTADELAEFVDRFHSPWIGVQFDIGNHQKYGVPAEWIRTLGHRIVKLDVKDWGKSNGFCKIGDGDVDWQAVRAALVEIGFCGWAAAEVAGGGPERLREILQRMDRSLELRP